MEEIKMGLFDRLQSVKEKFKSKVEARERQRYNNAINSNLELKEKIKTLKERKKVFNEKRELEQEVKGLEKKQGNPLLQRFSQNIKQKVDNAKKENKNPSFGFGGSFQTNNNPFMSYGKNSSPFVGGNSRRNYYYSNTSKPDFMFGNQTVKPKKETKAQQMKRKLPYSGWAYRKDGSKFLARGKSEADILSWAKDTKTTVTGIRRR